MSKDNTAGSARLLALNVAHYPSKYDELPLDETLGMIDMGKPNAVQLQLMASGMEVFVGVLGCAVSGIEELRH
ncbi:hypothetical protein [Candidatus Nitrotoga sp. 1052]|uniref:hypothetical protein n=1 Tax=Candidatus Nitrotoga sp. 1052 TaxID=2886964 RepID=UPI001EF4AC9C|nr:hypothetical protein [Candidatus Nitrotoga sp. 1052]CAH1081809.1 hypothetical protein NTG1052_410008 [Candidatus Nitrotoga sp. 1052]